MPRKKMSAPMTTNVGKDPRPETKVLEISMSHITSINWKDMHWHIYRDDDTHWHRDRRHPSDTAVIIDIVVDGKKETHLVRDHETVRRVGDRLELYR